MSACTSCGKHDPNGLVQGLCRAEYQRLRRTGSLKRKVLTLDELIEKARDGRSDDECWPWPGNIHKVTGYSRYGRVQAYRLIYETKIGPLPPGHQPDHTCHTNDPACAGGPTCPHRACVNYLQHMEAVTPEENFLRGNSPSNLNRLKDRCPANHPYDRVSVLKNGSSYRWCSICTRESQRRARAH